MENPTICLNMIVKDEADIIINTLTNLVDKIPIHCVISSQYSNCNQVYVYFD